ncbi:MAG: Re/Si-specific NAD(P)(+) transhydrogenase subunit alpha [Chitinophagales bacterium]
MIIGIIKEQKDPRVALVPAIAKKLIDKEQVKVWVEKEAGTGASSSDEDYQAAGAAIKSRSEVFQQADILVAIHPPSQDELGMCKSQAVVMSLFQPFFNKTIGEELKAMDLRAFSFDMIPRTSLAQSMDVLSSMASIAGYRAVLSAAYHFPSYFPMLITAAGSIPPAKALILGAGVAGLQAIATAKRLGAKVEAFDVRAAAKEEVESLGAKFVEVEGANDDKAAGGYAVEQTEEYKRRQRELVHERAMRADIIITTAQLRGRKAPILVEERTVEGMKKGSIIVDLAASTGGNCALTQNDKIIQHKGITIIGDSNLPAQMPIDASLLFSNNFYNYVKLMIKEGALHLDFEDEIIAKSYIC